MRPIKLAGEDLIRKALTEKTGGYTIAQTVDYTDLLARNHAGGPASAPEPAFPPNSSSPAASAPGSVTTIDNPSGKLSQDISQEKYASICESPPIKKFWEYQNFDKEAACQFPSFLFSFKISRNARLSHYCLWHWKRYMPCYQWQDVLAKFCIKGALSIFQRLKDSLTERANMRPLQTHQRSSLAEQHLELKIWQ